MKPYDQLISLAKNEVGYLEKQSNKYLDSKTDNAGNKNYTKYARDLFPALQAQPWCDMFVDWCFVQAFGNNPAKQLLCGKFDAYTPNSAQYYKDKGQYHTTDPQPGDQIFFRNSIRIYHTGIVEAVDNRNVYTIEGNTSGGTNVVANGGGVFEKSYPLNHSRIDGYGRPDWSIVDKPNYIVGWHKDSNGWWYADTNTSYYKAGWHLINHHWYYFNPDGYAVTNWQQIDGNWYYFEPTAGHPLECAMYVSDSNGVQKVGEF